MAGYKRKIILINPSYQLKFAFLISFAVFVSSLIYPLAIYDLFNSFLSAVRGSQAISERILNQRESLFYLLALWQFGFVSFVFIGCVLFSHKIAGPMYKLKKYLADFRDELTNQKLFFRRGDHFQDIAEEVNKTLESVSLQREQDFETIEKILQVIKKLEGDSINNAVKDQLFEIKHELILILKRHRLHN